MLAVLAGPPAGQLPRALACAAIPAACPTRPPATWTWCSWPAGSGQG